MNKVLSLLAAAIAGGATPAAAAELQVFNNLQLWYRADAGVTTNGSGNISVWADQSGNGNDATNTTAANQPLWVDNALGGKPVVRFDGVNDVLSSLTSVNLTNGLSIFIVAENDLRKNYNGLFRIHSVPYSGSADLEIYWQAGTAGSGNPVYAVNRPSPFGGLQAFNVPPAPGSYYVYDVIASTSSETQRVNGVTPASSVLGVPTLPVGVNPAHLGIGFGGVTTAGLLDGDIAEVIVYSSALTVSDRNLVEGYLADKYLLSIPEPNAVAYLGAALAALGFGRGGRRKS